MSRVSFASHDLGYPPWALEFDPYNRGYLLVGGGGGAGQKEVPNRLTLLDVSKRGEIINVGEADVVGDSPSSLGVLAEKDGVIAFAGANEEVKSGKGAHLRSFEIKYPKKEAQAKIQEIGRSSIFGKGYYAANDSFQRVLRLSPARKSATGAKRIGAIASSLVQPSEIVVFDATTATPTAKQVLHSIELQSEANDLDIFETGEGEFLLTYCTNTGVYLVPISYSFAKKNAQAQVAAPTLQYESTKAGSKLRGIRFLSKDLVLIVANRGPYSESFILKIYPESGPGNLVLRKNYVGRLTTVVSMDVTLLDADPTTGERQAVVVLAAQKNDVYMLTIDLPANASPKAINTYAHFQNVHDVPMKKVVLSPFFSPYVTSDGESKPPIKKPGPQVLHLASISLSNKLVIDTLPLHTKSTRQNPRYKLQSGPGWTSKFTNLFVIAFVLLVGFILAQAVIDEQSNLQNMPHYQLLPDSIYRYYSVFRKDNDPVKKAIHNVMESDAHIPGTHRSLSDLLHLHHKKNDEIGEPKKAIVIAPQADGSIKLETEVHDNHAEVEADPNAKSWDELSKKEQALWKKRLEQAGQWTVGQGEGILKSIFFSEVAGAVGRAAMEALNG